jgi:hypothetical protein
MTKKVSRLDLSLITGIEDDIFEIDTLYLGGLAAEQYATKTWVEGLLIGKVDYLGLVTAKAELPTGEHVTAGDFCRVGADFAFGAETAHAGDLLIAISNNPIQGPEGWNLIHNEYDWTHTHNYTVEGTTQDVNGVAVAAITDITGSISVPTVTKDSVAPQGHSHKIVTAGTISAPTINHEIQNTSNNSEQVEVVTAAVMPSFTLDKENQKLIIKFGSVTTGQAANSIHTHEYDKVTGAEAPIFTGVEVTSGENDGLEVSAVTDISASTLTLTSTTADVISYQHTHSVSIEGTTSQPNN